MNLIVNIFRSLGVPIAPRKTVGPVTQLEYLGIELDTVSMQARLPDDKLHRARTLVETFLGLSKYIKRELLSLLGHLQFASRVIVPGRSFISRLLEAARGARELHHFVTLNRQCKEELTMWHTLLKHWNRVSLSSILLVPLPPTCCCTLMHLAPLALEVFPRGSGSKGADPRVGRPHSRPRAIHGLQRIGSHRCGHGNLGPPLVAQGHSVSL